MAAKPASQQPQQEDRRQQQQKRPPRLLLPLLAEGQRQRQRRGTSSSSYCSAGGPIRIKLLRWPFRNNLFIAIIIVIMVTPAVVIRRSFVSGFGRPLGRYHHRRSPSAAEVFRKGGLSSHCQSSSSSTFLASSSSVNAENNSKAIPQQQQRRLYSRTAEMAALSSSSSASYDVSQLKFADTPLGRNGQHLLDGLDQYDVPSKYDGHPIAVFGIQSRDTPRRPNHNNNVRRPILLLHGRTWSSVPVFHLMGGTTTSAGGESGNESRSLMEALLERGMQPYCMDFRGFGGTHHDRTGYVEPNVCVHDVESVLAWIVARHDNTNQAPALLGWSQGALIAQLAAQKKSPTNDGPLVGKVILYGSIYDPHVHYPREPLYRSGDGDGSTKKNNIIMNDFDDAISDFTVEGTIPPEPARSFAEAALLSDPIKAVWRNLYQFNNCDPARVHVPCLVIAGDQDPYSSLHMQQELFLHLGRASDRTWSILTGCDHAVHLLDERERLINTVTSFVLN
jgi:pimeloyl-ACP methyl ester carboxylesterase